MRRLALLVGLALLLLPAASPALNRLRDGTLSVRAGKAKITIDARGAAIGQFDRGKLTVTDPVPYDASEPIIRGAEWTKEKTETTTIYGGTDVRFRLTGGTKYKIVLRGSGIDLSAVGRGTVTLHGEGEAGARGEYAVDGDAYKPIPERPLTVPLGG